jgi:hypothetical protein
MNSLLLDKGKGSTGLAPSNIFQERAFYLPGTMTGRAIEVPKQSERTERRIIAGASLVG